MRLLRYESAGKPALGVLQNGKIIDGEVRQESDQRARGRRPGPDLLPFDSDGARSGRSARDGDPEGVGAAMKPPVFLKPDDVARCEVERIGAIEDKVVVRAA